ncbi:MAG: ABC transporter ATP-binding protein [Ignavibacteriales bacterium]|nr:ABC transporter ATP-binding protein [Ignavibacteriales bacterium]
MKTFLRLSRYFLRYKWRIIAGLCSVAIMSLADTVSAFLVARLFAVLQQIQDFVQRGVTVAMDVPVTIYGITFATFSIRGYDESFRLIALFAAAILSIVLIKVIFVYVRENLMSSVQQKLLMRFRLDLFDNIVFFPVRYFDSQKTGRIMSRITNDVNALEQSLFQMVEMAQNAVYAVIFATALILTNWQLTIFTVVIFTISGIISRKFGDRIRSFSREITNTLADISSFLQEKINGIRIVKSFTREQYERKEFKQKVEHNYHYNMKIVRTVALLSPVNELFNTIVVAMLVVFTAYLFIQGSMTIEIMISFLILITFLAKPVKAIGENVARLQKSLVSAGFIFDMLDLEKEPLEEIRSEDGVIRDGRVEFKAVSFSYRPEVPALQSISFTVNAGEKVALVGPSGSGKTTLVNLIPRFYEVDEGTVLVDGRDIRTLGLQTLRSHIAIVPQEVMLFAGSIYDNIRYGRLEASRGEIEEAARIANAHEFIEKLEKAYETEVGERGVQLSGGQRQRIAIARAVLRDPRILLLDEATSALDAESEMAVQEALDRLMQGRTSFIIAHRLSTVYRCDRIFVLEKGKILEEGTHDELLRKDSGLYRRLYSLQFSEEGEFESGRK